MKRVLCPKCENYLFFDETKYSEGQSLVFECEHCDMSMDRRHCIINVKRNKQGKLVYTLRDAPSLTGTFLMNEILGDKDRVRMEDGAIVTIGATTFILHTAEAE